MFLPCSESKLTSAVASTATATNTSSSVKPVVLFRLVVPLQNFRTTVDGIDAQRVGVSLCVGEMNHRAIRVPFRVKARRRDSLCECSQARHEDVLDVHIGRHPHSTRE